VPHMLTSFVLVPWWHISPESLGRSMSLHFYDESQPAHFPDLHRDTRYFTDYLNNEITHAPTSSHDLVA
jgi:hypothetical protein